MVLFVYNNTILNLKEMFIMRWIFAVGVILVLFLFMSQCTKKEDDICDDPRNSYLSLSDWQEMCDDN